MINAFLLMVMIVIASGSTATPTFCALPDAIYADGVSSVTFGATGWNYLNQASWKNLVPTCGGSSQSPINIDPSTAVAETVPLTVNFQQQSGSIKYNVDSIPYTNEIEGEFSGVNGVDYTSNITYLAKQFHTHIPSEHTLNGVYQDMEVHFVHQATQYIYISNRYTGQDCNIIHDKLSVFGIFFKQTTGAADYDVFNSFFNSSSTATFDLSVFFNLMTDKTYYHYNGSLTTIPCSQTVNWYVFKTPLPINPAQYAKFQAYISNTNLFANGSNNRAAQRLNGRPIYTGTASIQSVTEIPQLVASAKYAMLLVTTFCFLI